jgi:hypothetical protein
MRVKLVVGPAMVATTAILLLAAPTAIAAPDDGGCATGFVEKEQNLPPGTKGAPSVSVNESTAACYKELPNAPQQLKDLIGVETVEVAVDDNRGRGRP